MQTLFLGPMMLTCKYKCPWVSLNIVTETLMLRHGVTLVSRRCQQHLL